MHAILHTRHLHDQRDFTFSNKMKIEGHLNKYYGTKCLRCHKTLYLRIVENRSIHFLFYEKVQNIQLNGTNRKFYVFLYI